MIPASTPVKTTGSLPTLDTIEFGIGDPRRIMEIGADMYSNREGAVARETATNAWDAHADAGHDRPIEVTLPSLWGDQTFVCRDYGPGMDLDDFKNVYTKFGYSTKRNTNSQTGSLGLGSKAPLAYTTQFEVISIKNGRKIHGVVERRDDWSVVMDILLNEPTTEPSGTEVRVPVHNIDEFNTKAMDIYRFWLPGRILVNGKQPEHNVGEKITDNLYYSTHWNMSYVVMGNVPYRIVNSAELFRGRNIRSMNFVAYVDMGEDGVDFTPAREDLKYTDRTKAALTKIIADFEDEILTKAKSEIAACTTHHEAYRVWTKWTGTLGGYLFGDLEFKGTKLSRHFPVDGRRWDTSASRYSVQGKSAYDVEAAEKTIFVTGFNGEVGRAQKDKMRAWFDFKGLDGVVKAKPRYVMFTPHATLSSPWVDPANIVSWDKVEAETPKVKKPRVVNTGPSRPKGSWDFWSSTGFKYEQALPDKGDIYYITVQDSKNTSVPTVMRAVGLPSDAVVIIVPANRLAKFLRENPKVKEIRDYAKSKVEKDGTKLLSADAKEYLAMSRDESRMLRTYDPKRISDPEFARRKALADKSDILLTKYRDNLALASQVGMLYNEVKQHTIVATQEPLLDRYPLLKALRHSYLDQEQQAEIYTYINGKYAELKKKGKI